MRRDMVRTGRGEGVESVTGVQMERVSEAWLHKNVNYFLCSLLMSLASQECLRVYHPPLTILLQSFFLARGSSFPSLTSLPPCCPRSLGPQLQSHTGRETVEHPVVHRP